MKCFLTSGLYSIVLPTRLAENLCVCSCVGQMKKFLKCGIATDSVIMKFESVVLLPT